jgi:hypothetical protein
VADGPDLAVAEVLKERVAEVMDRILRDCIALDSPVPEFILRVGRERIERVDQRHPHLSEVLLARLDPAAVYLHMGVPPDWYWDTVRCTPDRTVEQICVDAAETLQDRLIEGELWGAAWPSCPAHSNHPLWPELVDGQAVWRCDTGPQFRVRIGGLASDL